MKSREHEEIVMITPSMAKEWLSLNARQNNRRINRDRVAVYAEMMAAGRWVTSGDMAISFDEQGVISNGHHRLHAVIAFGQPVLFAVRRGVPLAAISYVDSFQARSNKQIGKMMGVDTRFDGPLRLIHSARIGSNPAISDVTRERLRSEFAESIQVVIPYCAMRVSGCAITDGVRAGMVLCVHHKKLKAVEFFEDFRLTADRQAIGTKASINLVRYIDNHRGQGGYAIANGYMAVTVNAFEQFVGGLDAEFVSSHTGKSSNLAKYLRSK